VTIGLLVATGWVLTEPSRTKWGTLPLVAATVYFMLRTRRSPVWMIGVGALAGIFGFV
jgi:chromate transporter